MGDFEGSPVEGISGGMDALGTVFVSVGGEYIFWGGLFAVGVDFATGSLSFLAAAPFASTDDALVTRGGAPFSTEDGTDFPAEEWEALAFSTGEVSAAFRNFLWPFVAGAKSDFTDANRRKTRG